MIIDSHTHISKLPNSPYSESFEKNLGKLLKEARANKIDRVLVIAGFEKKEDFNISTRNLVNLTARASNVSVIGSIDVLKYTKKDLVALEALMRKKLIVGIKLYTGYQHFYPNGNHCTPIYKICLKYNVPVVFHSGDTLAGYIKDPKIKYSHPIHIDEIATDFPDLKIVIAHIGNPWLVDSAEVLYKNPNVYADISGLVIGDDLNTPDGALLRRRIHDLLDYVGENKLLFGTDWPLCPINTYIKFVNTLKLPKEDHNRLLYKNAVKVFNLKI